ESHELPRAAFPVPRKRQIECPKRTNDEIALIVLALSRNPLRSLNCPLIPSSKAEKSIEPRHPDLSEVVVRGKPVQDGDRHGASLVCLAGGSRPQPSAQHRHLVTLLGQDGS